VKQNLETKCDKIMGHFQKNCPRCGTKQSSFKIIADVKSSIESDVWDALCRCGVCKLPILVRFEDILEKQSGTEPSKWAIFRVMHEKFLIIESHPEQEPSEIPHGTPDNVKLPLSEANESLADGRYSAAAACYRKVIERSLKHIDPSLTGMLNSRIRTLEKNGRLPPSLIELLDSVRLFGNEAMHEDNVDPSKEDCLAAKDFCELFLIYSFSLPEKIALAKSKHQN